MNLEIIGLNLCIYVVMVPVPSFCQPQHVFWVCVSFFIITVDFVRAGSFLFTFYVTTKLTTEIGKFICCLE